MKKIMTLLLMLALAVSLAACFQKPQVSEGNPSEEGAAFGIDLMKDGIQPMSDELATVDILRDTMDNYFEGIHLFTLVDNQGRTYADVKAYIGVDATQYQYKEGFGQRIYTWCAADSENSYLAVTFSEVSGQWTLLAVTDHLEEAQ